VDYETGGTYPVDDASMFLSNSPELAKIARINKIETPFLTWSENLTFDNWKKLAKIVSELLNKPENKGVIILQGTDFLHYSASALSFMLQDLGKPVILTYSQRSIDRGSSDAFLNLRCSFHAALSNIAEVIIVGHAGTEDNFCYALRGTKVRKMHSSRRDAFKAINSEPLAKIYDDGRIEKLSEYRKRDETKKIKLNNEFDDRVALIKYYPGMNPDILNYYVDQGYKGIIIEGSGFGNVATEGKHSWLPVLKKVCEKIIVCMTTQTIYGRTNPIVYSAGRMIEKTGVLYLDDMHSETAFAKLGCVLGKEKDMNKAKTMMKENWAHEFNERRTE
jgi:glutamyl-tRNA(Gln) amidotransferase subunit D